jgi:hypothetical protein
MGAMTLELVAAKEADLPVFRTAVVQHTLETAIAGALSGANGGRGLRGARGARGR